MSGDEGGAPQGGPTFSMSIPLPSLRVSDMGDFKSHYSRFRQMWDSYEILTGLDKKPDALRVATFIQAIGCDFLDIHNNLPYKSDAEKSDMKVILTLWDEHAKGKVNVIYERHLFNSVVQTNETLDEFISKCKQHGSMCEYGALQDVLIRDRIITGLKDKGLKHKLMNQDHQTLTLTKCIDICRTYRDTIAQVQVMTDSYANMDVNAAGKHYNNHDSTARDCKFCGQKHVWSKFNCQAYGKTCSNCQELNHFAVMCPKAHAGKSRREYGKSHKSRRKPKSRARAHAVKSEECAADTPSSDDTDSSESYEACVISVDKNDQHDEVQVNNVRPIHKKYDKKIVASMKIAGHPYPVMMQVDSGAECNVLPQRFVPAGSAIAKSNAKLRLYDDQSKIPIVGVCTLEITNPKNGQTYMIPFNVIQGLDNSMPLLGAYTSQVMHLIRVKKHNIANCDKIEDHVNVPRNVKEFHSSDMGVSEEEVMSKHAHVFEGLGHLPGLVHLETNKNVTPVIMPPRRVPLATKPKLQKEIQRLENLGVIKVTTKPTEWVSNLCIVTKPSGKIRLCIDPLHLNGALKRSHYPLPVIDDILPELTNVKVFSKADCKEGFLQCELDEESSYLTTFESPWGRYRYTRLPFGVKPAPEIFQQKLDQCLEGLDGIYKIADDILITGQGQTLADAMQDHDRNMEHFLTRCSENNIKLNKDKFMFKSDKVSFIGHTLTRDGLKVDDNKVEAISKMPQPTDVQGIQRFLGMTKYLAKFLPDLSADTEPLRRLTHKDTPYIWTEEQTHAFQNVKSKVQTTPCLRYFDPAIETEGQGDASENGLGFALLQQGQPVTYASRALTPAETRYSQIEKELLAQVFGLERNHIYAYGRKVTLWTDHKPLVSISRKPLASAPKRLQRLLLRLSHYDVEIKYKPGKEMYLADTLSRAYLNNTERSHAEEETESVNMCEAVPISSTSYTDIQNATASDNTLQAVKLYVLKGWPDNKKLCQPETRPYFDLRDELSYQDGVIFRGTRVVVPQAARKVIRERLHRAHSGIQSTIRRAKECVHWPGMASDLQDFIAKCEACNSYQPAQPKEPLKCHKLPERPWQKIAVDLFAVEGVEYVCTVDCFSDYFETDRITHKKDSNAIINILQKHFTTHGIPEQIFSDNGPPFNSRAFSDFAKEFKFTHKTSSPEFPQSNGKVEATVKIAKNIIKKTQKDHGNLNLAFLAWRNTPTEGLDSSPAQRFFGRRTRTLLPMHSDLLKQELQHNVKDKKLNKQRKQEEYFNRGATALPLLRTGDVVRMKPRANQGDKVWTKARVIEQVESRSYRVMTEDGREYIRNRRHLRVSKETFEPKYTDTEDETQHKAPNVNLHPNANKRATEDIHQQQPVVQPRRSTRDRRRPAYLSEYAE